MASPEYSANQGTSEALPKGAAKALNDSLPDEVDPSQIDLSRVEEPVEFPVDDSEQPDQFSFDGDITGLDNLVFGPSERPTEPISHGAPWGEGPDAVEGDPRKFRQDVGRRLLETPNMSPQVKNLAARMVREG
jgi:hypothetical protein